MNALRWTALAAALLLGAGGLAHGAGGGTSGAQPGSDFVQGTEAADAGDWQRAIGLFARATERDPDNADAWNMLAYSQRRAGDLESAFENYRRALILDPEHKDAHEYIGEAYLQIGDLDAAERHLEVLDEICWLGCSQLDDLAQAIEDWKAARDG